MAIVRCNRENCKYNLNKSKGFYECNLISLGIDAHGNCTNFVVKEEKCKHCGQTLPTFDEFDDEIEQIFARR
jgi:hypothetical protein